MEKVKVLHIHTDIKFIQGTERFESEIFDNQIVILTSKKEYVGPYKDKVLILTSRISDLKKVILMCEGVHAVVLYDLSFVKCYIVNRLSKSVKIIWRFFGLELYSRMPEYVYSNLTLELLSKEKKQQFISKFYKSIILKSKHILKYRTSHEKEFTKAINRANYFLGLSEMEYLFLKSYSPNLPPFIQLPFSHLYKLSEIENKKEKIVILGNNRSSYNNHLDILDIVVKSKRKHKISFLLLFNYGRNNYYSESVRKMADQILGLTVLEDFLSYEDFKDLYITASAFVLNGYRQMAMANIFQAIENDVKIYLNEKNVILRWLKSEGFLIFTINDFINDIETNNIQLSPDAVQHNREQMLIFTEKYNEKDFHNKLIQIVTKDAT